MTYSRIKRGAMGGDHYTQIRNAVFRDTRLSAKAMGVFGNLSTHTDGYGITVEAISRQMKDGVAAVKGALRELEEFGYLVREQEHLEGGSWGGSVYFVTDDPAAQLNENMPRSAPIVDFRLSAVTSDNTETMSNSMRNTRNISDNSRSEPIVDFTPAVNPPAVNRRTKKTSTKKTKRKNIRQAGSARARETGPPPDGPACLPDEPSPGEQLLRRLPQSLATAQVIRQHAAAVDALLDAGWPTTALHKHLAAECDGHAGPGRLVHAIRETPASYTPRSIAPRPQPTAESAGPPPPPPIDGVQVPEYQKWRAQMDSRKPHLAKRTPVRSTQHA